MRAERGGKDHVGLTGALKVEQDSQSVFDAIHGMRGHHPNSAQQPFLGDRPDILTFDEAPLLQASLWRIYLNMEGNTLGSCGYRKQDYQTCRAVIKQVYGNDQARPSSRLFVSFGGSEIN